MQFVAGSGQQAFALVHPLAADFLLVHTSDLDSEADRSRNMQSLKRSLRQNFPVLQILGGLVFVS